jgi:hypothetical protein
MIKPIKIITDTATAIANQIAPLFPTIRIIIRIYPAPNIITHTKCKILIKWLSLFSQISYNVYQMKLDKMLGTIVQW